MKTILLLGGYGYTGKCLARHLLKHTQARIIVCGRNLEKAKAFTAEINDSRLIPQRVDATDIQDLGKALQGVSLCLVAAPVAGHINTILHACLETGVDYLDIQYSSGKLETLFAERERIKGSGLCFVTEAGYHPGLPAAMVRFAASRLDSIESALTAGYLNIHGIPYSEAVDELMQGFIDYQAQVYRDGAWTKKNQWDMRTFDFGSQIGKRTCYSMFFEEMRALPEMHPSLKETGFYISGSNWFADLVVTPLVMVGLKIAPQRGLKPLGKLTWWAMQRSRPPYLVALQVEARGTRNGQETRVRARIEHPDGYELTAIPVVAFLKQYLDGSARQEGLHMMGHLADPVRLFEDMQGMGAGVTVEE